MGWEASARAREVQRYYQPWLASFHATSLPTIERQPALRDHKNGYVPQSSKDRALTAFTQLGALRLNVRRCVVTLIDDDWQYILAEATRTISLMRDDVHDPGDELWLGNAMIPRGQGVSEYAMDAAEYIAKGPGDEECRSRALVIPDIGLDDRFKNKPYAGSPVYFYAGVPLVANEHAIGVFTVTDDQPRDGLSARELRIMVDMANIVMHHLETIKNDRARARGERLIEGIGQFIEGDSSDAQRTSNPSEKAQRRSLTKDHDQHHHHKGSETTSDSTESPQGQASGPGFPGLTLSNANTLARGRFRSEDLGGRHGAAIRVGAEKSADNSGHAEDTPHSQSESNNEASTKLKESVVFTRAAAILRKCMRADGVVFVDASVANLSKGTLLPQGHQPKSPTLRRAGMARANGSFPHNALSRTNSYQVDGDEFERRPLERTPTIGRSGSVHYKPHDCQVLALSVKDSQAKVNFKLAEDDLKRILDFHSSPHCYSFDRNGRVATGEDSADSETSPNKHFMRSDKPLARKNPLVQTLPGARTIAFLPLWDLSKSKIHSCAIVWSVDPTKMLSINDDFSYLTAFGNAVMNEIARINLRKSDTAKAKFLANISHELRSPLHGILGSIEFLHDTPLDDFQSNMVINVETCGKTLLDTVNHVLDFSKLHNLSAKGSNEGGVTQATITDTTLTSDFDLAIIVEEAVEAVYAGQIFRMANADALEGKAPSLSSSGRSISSRQNSLVQIQAESSPIRLTLNIDNSADWHVSSQPGAVRRIVMNLLGNSLKYTERGSIHVSLELDETRQEDNEDFLHTCITVTDTGKGMSEDFVRNHAFTAFSQENSLTSGTGLGLSIIRQIVDSLGGKIDMRSQQGQGTEIKIWLSFCTGDENETTAETESEKTILRQMQERTSGFWMCLLNPNIKDRHEQPPPTSLEHMPSVEESLRTLIAKWYSIDVFSATYMRGTKADIFVYAAPPPIGYLLDQHGGQPEENETPIIIITQNAFQANSLRANGIHQLTEKGRIIEIIAQPIGPQKLAKVLQRCLQRTKRLEQPSEAPSGEEGKRSAQANDTMRSENSQPNVQPTVQPSQELPKPNTSLQMQGGVAQAPSGTTEQKAAPNVSLSPLSDDIDLGLARVLVVDDNSINLRLLATFVRRTHHPYESATDGQQAVNLYKDYAFSEENRFKFVFMDLSMPVMGGAEATKAIRKFEKERGIKEPAKIIALTGRDDSDAAETAQKAGFDLFLSKPVKFNKLKELLD